MSQFSLVLIGRHENRDEAVAQAMSAAFGQGVEWGRPVVVSAPIVLLEGLTETQAHAVHGALQRVEAAGCKFGVYAVGSAEIDGCSKLRWPTPPAINGYPLDSYNQAGPGSGGGTAGATAQINCPHCGGSFRIGLNILSGAAPSGSPRASARQPSPALGTPTPGPSLTSSGSYAPQSQGPGAPLPVGYGAQGVGTSSGFYQLPGSNAMINPAQPQNSAQQSANSGPNTPPPQSGVGGSGTISLPAAQPLPKARSATPSPGQTPQPGLAPRPATPDRGQARPSPQSGQRQISPSMGQPTGGRPQSPTPGTGMTPIPPRKPNSGHYGKPEGTGPAPGGPGAGTRAPIELPAAQPLPSSHKPGSNSSIPTLPPVTGGSAATPGGPGQAKNAPPVANSGGSEYTDLQGPMSLDEFEAHISGIHAPIDVPPPPSGKKPPPPARPGPRRPGGPRR
ncbi:MAG TPA: hypothetical protein VL860_04725 [Planctomycetota bacterium]|nr:hypothetical protein [Planctomycetota bacterium]